jgi:hypothetical protein
MQQKKLKPALAILAFGATMFTLFASNYSDRSPVGGVDVRHISPRMLSITSKVVGQKPQANDSLTALPTEKSHPKTTNN